LIIPFIVVIPGIVAYVLFTQPEGTSIIPGVKEAFSNPDGGINYDKAYPWLISTFIPVGLKGLVLAALTAAIVSSLASMLNSTSTIFTMDIYKPYFGKNSDEKRIVKVGRIASAVALVIAVLMAPLLGNIPQMFQYIQEYTGLVSPGVLAVFIMGLFWKKTTNKAAIIGLDQMFYTCIITMVIIAGVTLTTSDTDDDPKGISLTAKLFKTDPVFNISSYIIIIILAVLYALFW
jgi:SSS family solute:Na+ symporter